LRLGQEVEPRASENGAVFFEILLSRLAKISIRRQIDKK
jgi:hypothetical protein